MYFEDGSKTNFILNVLLLSDISAWKIRHLQDLLEMIENFVEESYETNRLLLSYNPLLSIALSADILTKIAFSRRRFQDQCLRLKDDILQLGKVFNAKIENEEYYKDLITDIDFKGRTVLSIICNQHLQPLMSEDDPKAENLIMNIWNGEESTKCDGNIYGFSNLTHVLGSKAKKATDSKTKYFDIVSNYFKPNFKDDYQMQHKYRSKDISNYFRKEFVAALIIVLVFTAVNNFYVSEFKGPQSYFKTSFNETTGLELTKI